MHAMQRGAVRSQAFKLRSSFSVCSRAFDRRPNCSSRLQLVTPLFRCSVQCMQA
jgi:hypothetical protein